MAIQTLYSLSGEKKFSGEYNSFNEMVQDAVNKGLDLTETNFNNESLTGIDFKRTSLNRSKFNNMDLQACILRTCDLEGCEFNNVKVKTCDLRHANGYDIIFNNCYIIDCDFTQCHYYQLIVKKTYIKGCNFAQSVFDGCSFIITRIYCSSFKNLIRMDSSFHICDFNKVDFTSEHFKPTFIKCSFKDVQLPQHVLDIVSLCPKGDLYVYKALREGVCELLIPKEAKRVSGLDSSNRKCRAEFAIVKKLPCGYEVGSSRYDPNFLYRVGETVYPTLPFDDNPFASCSSGIHFFLTEYEAQAYYENDHFWNH